MRLGRFLWRDRRGGEGLLLPLILLVGLCFALSVGAMIGLVRRLDTTAAAQMHQTVHGTVQAELAAAADGVFENARWDDAVRHLYGDFDQRWAEANISGSGLAYVVDHQGRNLFSKRSNGVDDPPLDQVARQSLRFLLSKLPRTRAGAVQMRTGISAIGEYRGRPAFLAAMAILPLQEQLPVPERELRYLIHVMPIDSTKLASWSSSFRLSHLRYGDEGSASLALRDHAGRKLATLSWTPPRPGTQALREVALPLILALIMLIALAWWLLSGLRQQAQALVSTSDAQRRAAEQAESARVQAEQARLAAELAAAREIEARHRHEQELRVASRAIGQSLRETFAQLSADLLRSAEALDRSADRTASTIKEQQEQVQQVRARAESTAAAIDGIEEEVRSFTESVREIAAAARQAESHVANAADRSNQGAEIGDHLIEHLEAIERTTGSIAQIAAQTNMLALNATIEAARGGGNAAGFAVVAGEVKALAGRVSTLTAEVTAQLRRIASSGRDTAEMSGAVQRALGSVQQSIATTASAAARQDQASATINLNIGRVSDEAERMEDVIQAVAASAQEIVETARSTRDISGEVRTHARVLLARLDEAIEKLLAA